MHVRSAGSLAPTSSTVRLVVAALAVCTFLPGAVVPALAAPSSTPLSGATLDEAPECTGEAATVDDAAALLAVCEGEAVTITDSLTPWETGVLDPGSGDVVMTTSTQAQRQDSDGDGQWAPVDVQVVAEPVATGDLAGMLPVVGGVTPMWLNPGGATGAGLPLVVLGQPDERVSMHSASLPIGEAGQAVVAGRGVSYDFGQGVTLSVTTDRDGVRATPVVELADPAALDHLTGDLLPEANAAPLSLSFPVETSPGLAVRSADAGFEVVDVDDDEVRFESGAALQWDSAGGDSAGAAVSARAAATGGSDGPSAGDNVTTMDVEVGADGVVTVIPDAQMFSDASTTWPVSLDPELGAATPWGYTMVQNYAAWKDTPHWKFDGAEGVGLCEPARDPARCPVTNLQRQYFQFQSLRDGNGVWLGQLEAKDVYRATFRVVGVHQFDCTNREVDVLATDPIDSATVWDSQPALRGWQETRSVTHRDGCANRVTRTAFEVTKRAKEQAAADVSWMTFLVRTGDESSMSWWRRYEGSTASLEVIYDRAPNPPSASSMDINISPGGVTESFDCTNVLADRPVIRGKNPTLVAKASDPDGTNVVIRFRVYEFNTGVAIWTSDWSPPVGPNTEAAKVVQGLATNTEYRWEAAVRSSNEYAGWDESPSCRFRTDFTDPADPRITDSNYPREQVAGGVGTNAWFDVCPNGSADITRFWWDLDTSEPEAHGWSVTPGECLRISTPIESPGYHYFAVQSEDASGRTSGVTKYVFYVRFPHATGHWQFNDVGWQTSPPMTAQNRLAGSDLSRTAGVGWGWGYQGVGKLSPLRSTPETGGVPDGALVFDSPTDLARTTGPVVGTDQSFSVVAFLRADELGGSSVAVSQAGRLPNGDLSGSFHLGYTQNAACGVNDVTAPDGLKRCWSFWMTEDDGGISMARVPVEVTLGEWYMVAGVHDAGTDTIHAYACKAGGFGEVSRSKLNDGQDPAYRATWNAQGLFRLGSGISSTGESRSPFVGAIDEVRVYKDQLLGAGNASDIPDKLKRLCRYEETP
ncbi:LamG-like jellyroll fold domain-containing protein [Promicromonospora sp. NPDC050880]|uniref:LamG-like jellyroll fold domain-containing protein n=1 Tax=Promicromonospora sp. NPDC050880 TaxID=3364406 RepID=UPI00378C44D5